MPRVEAKGHVKQRAKRGATIENTSEERVGENEVDLRVLEALLELVPLPLLGTSISQLVFDDPRLAMIFSSALSHRTSSGVRTTKKQTIVPTMVKLPRDSEMHRHAATVPLCPMTYLAIPYNARGVADDGEKALRKLPEERTIGMFRLSIP